MATCDPCCPEIEVTNVPGSEGDPGAAGAAGTNGISSFTLLTADATLPAVGAPITIAVGSNAWTAIGQTILISDGTDVATITITAKAGTTGITGTFLGAPGDAAPAAVVGTGGLVVVAGPQPATPIAIADGGTGQATIQAAITALGLKKTPLSVYAAGTAYQLTAVSALLNFGTTDPSLTIDAAGVYLLLSRARIDYTGATFAAVRTGTLKLRRTNNTAADLTNSSTSFLTDIITTLTYTLGIISLPPVIYTTTNANDVIELWGDISVVPTAGSIDAVQAEIVAVRLFDQTL